MQHKRESKRLLWTLPSGVRVVAEPETDAQSVSIGIWVGAGSMTEAPGQSGYSHFIEHLLFKGAGDRDAQTVAREMDALGGRVNAFTEKECTCYYAQVIAEHGARALRLLADLVTRPRFDAVEFERERGVVLEEIAMSQDAPEDLVSDLAAEAIFGDHPLGRPILGTEASIESASREDVIAYWRQAYRPERIVISLVGGFDLDQMKDECERLFTQIDAGAPKPEAQSTTEEKPRCLYREQRFEQTHLCLSWPCAPLDHPDTYPEAVLSMLLGEGNTSRLFQRIREQMGAAYEVYSDPMLYPDCGVFTVGAAATPAKAKPVLAAIREEIDRLLADGVKEDEVSMAKEQLRIACILEGESRSARMTSNGRGLLLLGRIREQREVLDHIAAVTREDVQRAARRVFTVQPAAAFVGRGAKQLSADAEAMKK